MQKTEIRPIETEWRGYRFRSRLEARWAVFFSALGLHWEYEPEGFELGDGLRYLPDFRVQYPGRDRDEIHHVWFEVKGDPASLGQKDWEKLVRFEQAEGLILLDGSPDARMYMSPSEWLDGDREQYPRVPHRPFRVDKRALEHKRDGMALWSAKGRLWWDEHDNFFSPTTYFGTGTEIEDAVDASRAARFEFGQVPA